MKFFTSGYLPKATVDRIGLIDLSQADGRRLLAQLRLLGNRQIVEQYTPEELHKFDACKSSSKSSQKSKLMKPLLTTEQSPRDRAVRACNCLIASFHDCNRLGLRCGKWAADTLKTLKQPLLPGANPAKEAIDCLLNWRSRVGQEAELMPANQAIATHLQEIYSSLRSGMAAEMTTKETRRGNRAKYQVTHSKPHHEPTEPYAN